MNVYDLMQCVVGYCVVSQFAGPPLDVTTVRAYETMYPCLVDQSIAQYVLHILPATTSITWSSYFRDLVPTYLCIHMLRACIETVPMRRVQDSCPDAGADFAIDIVVLIDRDRGCQYTDHTIHRGKYPIKNTRCLYPCDMCVLCLYLCSIRPFGPLMNEV